jgi:hypothetical protein
MKAIWWNKKNKIYKMSITILSLIIIIEKLLKKEALERKI